MKKTIIAAGLILMMVPAPVFGAVRYPHEADHQVWANNHLAYQKPYTSVPVWSAGEVKKFEDYRCITDTTSAAYRVTHQGVVMSDGTLSINGRRLVAVGTAIGHVGDKLDFVLTGSEGRRHVLKTIVADSKQTQDTAGEANYMGADGHIIEALVCTEALPTKARIMGDLSYIPGWDGRITEIRRVKC
jgi:hypothetical protein